MAHGLGIILAWCIFITLVSLSLGKMYDIGEEPTSCPAIPELPPPFEGWEYLTCKSDTWMWASLNASIYVNHDMACDLRQNTEYGEHLNQWLYYVISEDFLDRNFENPRIGKGVEILKKLVPKRKFWYYRGYERKEDKTQTCLTYSWSEETNDFDTPVETDCNEEHYAICFGVLLYHYND